MTSRINTPFVICSISVAALYLETILQIYVTVSSDGSLLKNPLAIVSLGGICISFVSTSVASYIFENFSETPSTTDESASKSYSIIINCLHLFQASLIWRVFRLFFSFSGSDVKQLSDFRLVHTAIQSLPFLVMYSASFLVGGKITAIQTLSLVLSLISSTISVSCYNLRNKLCNWSGDKEEGVSQESESTVFKPLCGVLATFVGTCLVLFSRSMSITLLAAEVRIWVLLPLSLHFVIMIVVFGAFSSRNRKNKTKQCRLIRNVSYIFGISVLNTFDLVYGNVTHVMCKYVSFYSLLLVENIIFISFWLLSFEMEYVSRLVIVVGVLSGFILGLLIKFTGCNILYREDHRKSELDDISAPIATTAASLSFSSQSNGNKHDDLFSIVQASLVSRSNSHAQTHEQLLAIPNNQERRHPKIRTKNSKRGFNSHNPKIENTPCSLTHTAVAPLSYVNGGNAHDIFELVPRRSSSSLKELKTSNKPDAHDNSDSFQHSSLFSVSDPETLLSDMMYNELGVEVSREIPCSTLEAFKQNSRTHRKSSLRAPVPLEVNGLQNHSFANKQMQQKHRKDSLPKGKLQKLFKMPPLYGKSAKPEFPLSNANHSHQQESSDTAISSAKTYPYSPRVAEKNDGTQFDQRMKTILFSIDNKDARTTETPAFPLRYSDSEVASKSKVKTHEFTPLCSNDRYTCKNIISYTEAEVVNSVESGFRDRYNKESRHISPVHKQRGRRRDHQQRGIKETTIPRPLGPGKQLCPSGSSSLTTTVTNAMGQTRTSTASSGTSTITTEDCWRQDTGQSSDAKSDRLSQFLQQSDSGRMSPSENVLRWLSTTRPLHSPATERP